MGVVISKPPINLREKLTELKAQQGYEERQFHFDNLVTNGTFDTDLTGWTTTAPATATWFAGQVDLARNSGSAVQQLYQSLTPALGSVYKVNITVSALSHNVGVYSTGGGVPIGSTITTTGDHTLYFVGKSGDNGIYVGAGGAGTATATVDNVSVYEVDPADNKVIHTMPKGWKPLHVFEDGALQREGSAYDYTVEYDGFNYVIKETVAPVAPYSTTVIGVRA